MCQQRVHYVHLGTLISRRGLMHVCIRASASTFSFCLCFHASLYSVLDPQSKQGLGFGGDGKNFWIIEQNATAEEQRLIYYAFRVFVPISLFFYPLITDDYAVLKCFVLLNEKRV